MLDSIQLAHLVFVMRKDIIIRMSEICREPVIVYIMLNFLTETMMLWSNWQWCCGPTTDLWL